MLRILEDISYSIDWLTNTFDFIQFHDVNAPFGSIARKKYEEGKKNLEKLYSLLTYGNSSEITVEKRKFKDYSSRVYLGEFIQFFLNGCKNGRDLYHSKFEMSGNACRDFISRGGNWFDLFKFLYTGDNAVSNKPTRIDIAIDVRTKKYFTFEKLVDVLYSKGNYSSTLRDITYIGSKRRVANDFCYKGNTLYLGSMSSDVYLCIYDKKLERIQIDDSSNLDSECWYRIEIRFRNENALWFIQNLLLTEDRNDYSFIMDALYKVLDIKTENGSETIRNRETVSWWKIFLNDATKAKFNDRDIPEITLEKKKKYVEVNAGMSLSQVLYCFDDPLESVNYIFDLLDEKTIDMQERQIKQINEFRKSKKLKPFKNYDELLEYKEKIKYLVERLENNG